MVLSDTLVAQKLEFYILNWVSIQSPNPPSGVYEGKLAYYHGGVVGRPGVSQSLLYL
jgi:hypothetical protein